MEKSIKEWKRTDNLVSDKNSTSTPSKDVKRGKKKNISQKERKYFQISISDKGLNTNRLSNSIEKCGREFDRHFTK